MDAAYEADAKRSEDTRVDPASLKALRSLVQTLQQDPAVIHAPDLLFFKEFLQSWDAKIPAVESKPKPGTEEPAAPKAEPPKAEVPKAEEPEEEEEEEEEPEEPEPEEEDPERLPEDPEPYPESGPQGEVELSDEQLDAQGALKQAAVEAVEDGNLEEALKKYTEAIKMGNVSAMMYAKRAELLLKLKRPNACISDCNAAIGVNPDSGKAYRIRGKAHRKLGHWEDAHKDISTSQKLDFDDDMVDMHKFVDEKFKKINERQTRKRLRVEERAQKKREAEIQRRREAIKKQQEEQQKREEAASGAAGGFPGGFGMPPGFFDDPDIKKAMENPKVAEVMQNPANCFKYQDDPEVMGLVKKLMEKFGAGMGMGGMPGMGGMGGAQTAPTPATPGPTVEEDLD
mmetsp:Transcript_83480/g.202442  ORF Transcript_83480/g.202442 Transcript_83480/m.202442 type:complete len:399 (-) Transcript_83480:114-1310(-)